MYYLQLFPCICTILVPNHCLVYFIWLRKMKKKKNILFFFSVLFYQYYFQTMLINGGNTWWASYLRLIQVIIFTFFFKELFTNSTFCHALPEIIMHLFKKEKFYSKRAVASEIKKLFVITLCICIYKMSYLCCDKL